MFDITVEGNKGGFGCGVRPHCECSIEHLLMAVVANDKRASFVCSSRTTTNKSNLVSLRGVSIWALKNDPGP